MLPLIPSIAREFHTYAFLELGWSGLVVRA